MAFVKPDRDVWAVYLHCSASDADYEADELYEFIRRIHVDENGWSDVGYHYMIDKKGTLMAGRSLEKTPAAQAGHNTGSIAIMLHGLDKGGFTQAQFDSLKALCNGINEGYRGRITFHGHCEVSDKTCPVFDYKAVIDLDRFGRMP